MAVSGTGIVLCRLAAVFLLVRGIEQLGFALSVASSPTTDSWQASFSGIIAVVAPIIAAALIWRLAPRICTFGGQDFDPTLKNNGGEKKLIAIGTFLVGLYALLFGLTNAVSVEVGFWAQEAVNRNTRFPTDTAWIQSLSSRAPYAAQIILGVGLMLGRNGVASVFSKLRYAGTGAS